MTALPAGQVLAAFLGGFAWQAFYSLVWRPAEDRREARREAARVAREAVAEHAASCPAAQLLAEVEGR